MALRGPGGDGTTSQPLKRGVGPSVIRCARVCATWPRRSAAGAPGEGNAEAPRWGGCLPFWVGQASRPAIRRPHSPGLRPGTPYPLKGENENSIYKHIIPALDKIQLSKLTANDLQQFYTQMKKNGRLIRTQIYGDGLSDRMVRACHTRCLTALDRAMADGLIRINPAADCKLPGQALKDMNLLTREEMQRLLIQAKEEGYYELFLLELATGLRRGETLALQWDDLDFNTGALHIQRQVYRANGELVVSAPKTKAALRTIVLPSALVGVLEAYHQGVNSRWMFPSPAKVDSPLDPATVRKRLQTILKHAGCRKVRFHDLRHLFVTTALENGMDVKTLSTIIGHVSAKTTLNIYTHVTDAMRQTAAAKIDRGIGKCESPDGLPTQTPSPSPKTPFEPYRGKIRKSGTGCVTKISDHLWEGKFSPKWPDGKKHSRSVYASTETECEEKLADLIREMKTEIAEAKRLVSEGRWEEVMALAGQKKARGTKKVV